MSEFLKPAIEAPEGETIYRFISDPGHGWLEVRVADLHELGIATKISSFSYINDDMAYLEEDCDMSVFLRAKEASRQVVYYRNIYQEISPIRYFDSYRVVS